jgi:hypothetical protein
MTLLALPHISKGKKSQIKMKPKAQCEKSERKENEDGLQSKSSFDVNGKEE